MVTLTDDEVQYLLELTALVWESATDETATRIAFAVVGALEFVLMRKEKGHDPDRK